MVGEWIEKGDRIFEIVSINENYCIVKEVLYLLETPKLKYGETVLKSKEWLK